MEPNTIEFLERLLDISRHMAENRELDALLNFAMSAAMELVNAEQGHLILLTNDGTLNFSVSNGVKEEISHSILDRVLGNGEPLRITDALSSEDFMGALSVQDFQLRSIMSVPLISRHKLLGVVYVENRSHANIFHEAHLDVLVYFAKQAAVLIENALLTAHLQKTREKMVSTREEERRRIRRELHNELGPSLATLRLEMDTAQKLLLDKNKEAAQLLDGMQAEVEAILKNVRQIAHDLYPSVLHELGLRLAMQEYLTTCNRSSNLQFEFVAPDQFSPLSAAVELALYRIVQEAVSIVTHQPDTTHCLIRLVVEHDIFLEIWSVTAFFSDDTRIKKSLGVIAQYVAELGGRVHIEKEAETRIRVHIPLLQ